MDHGDIVAVAGGADGMLVEAGEGEGADDMPVPHSSLGGGKLLRLYRTNGGQRLQHSLTGEIVELAERADPWRLLYDESGFGYLCGGGDKVWANSLLKRHLFDCEQGLYMQEAVNDGIIVEWVSEAQRKYETKYVSWAGAEDQCAMRKLSVITMCASINGNKVFFNLGDIQEAADFETGFARKAQWFKKMISSWESFLASNGVDPSSLLRPSYSGAMGELRVAKWHASSTALLLILLQGSTRMHNAADQKRCKFLLRGFLRNMLDEELDFEVDISGDGSKRTVRIQKLVVVSVQPPSWQDNHIMNVTIDEALVFMLNTGRSCFADFVQAIGREIDYAFMDSQWTMDPLQCLTPSGARRRVDRQLRRALGELPMKIVRNQFRMTKMMATMGINGAHRSWVDGAYMRRYLLAMRKGCGNGGCCTNISLASDKSRGSGRDYLSTMVMNPDQKLVGWLQPVAIRGDSQIPSEV